MTQLLDLPGAWEGATVQSPGGPGGALGAMWSGYGGGVLTTEKEALAFRDPVTHLCGSQLGLQDRP